MVAVNYDWDEVEDNIDEEFDDAGSTSAEYTNEPYLYGDLISQHRDGQSRFYCFDILGSTLALTDSTGTVTDTNAYTAFGEVTEHTGSTVNPFQYVGQKGGIIAARRFLRSSCEGEHTHRTTEDGIRLIPLVRTSMPIDTWRTG